MFSDEEIRQGAELLARRICQVTGGATSNRRGRLAAVLRSADIIDQIGHPKALLAIVEKLGDPSNPARFDDGTGPMIYLREEDSNEIDAFDSVELLFSDDEGLRSAGIEQIERVVAVHCLLENSVDSFIRMMKHRKAHSADYWNAAIDLYDALRDDPFWRITAIRQLSKHEVYDQVAKEIIELVSNMNARTDFVQIANSEDRGLFSIIDGRKCRVRGLFSSWSSFIAELPVNKVANEEESNLRVWQLLTSLSQTTDKDRIAELLVKITKEEDAIPSLELAIARSVFLEIQAKFLATETDLVVRTAWLIATSISEATSSLPGPVIESVYRDMQVLAEQKRLINLLWPAPTPSGIEYQMSFHIDRPWTLAGLMLATRVQGAISTASSDDPEWTDTVRSVLRAACIMELRSPFREIRNDLPGSVAELTAFTANELNDDELSAYSKQALEVLNNLDQLTSLPDELAAQSGEDPIAIMLMLMRAGRAREDSTEIATKCIEVIASNNWISSRIARIDEDKWLLVLETLVGTVADSRIDPDRKLPWALCNMALDSDTDGDSLAAIVSTTIIAAIRQESPNVTDVLTSRLASDKIRTMATQTLITMNDLFGQSPEIVRSRLRPHLQYLGWVH